jgi:hypothetical protein
MAVTNVLTTVGKTYIATKLADTTTTTVVPKWIGIGTGVHTAAAGDTALTTEVETRGSTNAATSSTNVFQVIQTITATAVRSVTEAGLFSALTGGTMIVSSTFDVVTLQIGDSIQITAQITFA